MTLPPVAILAGGRGTRLGALVRETPKPLVEVAGRPFLFHVLELLHSHGAAEIVLCVGYLGAQIEAAVGDGSAFDVHVQYSYDDMPGTARALRRALPLLGEEFLVVYGDAYLRVDYAGVVGSRGDLPALMTVLPWAGGNAGVDAGKVVRYDKCGGLDWIDHGVQVLTPAALAVSATDDLPELQAELAARGLLGAYVATEPFYEIGTPEGLDRTDAYLRTQAATE